MKKQVLRHKLKAFFFVLFFVSISCSSSNIRFPILNDIQLNELEICGHEIIQQPNETEKGQYCSNIFSLDNEELFLCGDISGIRDVDAHLDIYLFKEGVERVIFYNSSDDNFTNGFFCRPVALPDKINRRGAYVIELRDARDILGSIEFEIK